MRDMKQHKVKQREKKMNKRCLPIPSLNSRLVLAFKSQLKEMKNPMSIYSSFVSLSFFLSFFLSLGRVRGVRGVAALQSSKVQEFKSEGDWRFVLPRRRMATETEDCRWRSFLVFVFS